MQPKELEKAVYLLDTRGYVIVRRAFAGQVERANALIDEHTAEYKALKFTYFHLDDLFLDMMQHPVVLQIAEAVLGQHFRMDHAFGVQQTKDTQINLHGGQHSGSGVHTWQSRCNKRPICHGQLSCSIALSPQGGDKGGVCMLPGSHHSQWPAEGYQLGNELFGGEVTPDFFACPELNPGDVLLFPECLVHGNAPWKVDHHVRRNIYYMYFPGHSTWRSWPGQQERHYNRARTALERRLLRPPSVGNYDDAQPIMGPNVKAAPTLG